MPSRQDFERGTSQEGRALAQVEIGMGTQMVVLRRWVGRIRTADEAEYTRYIAETGVAEYRATPGNLGAQMLMRALGEGVSEVTTLSWWSSEDAIRAFAGEDIGVAKYYPEDERFLLDRPHHVDHFRVVASLPVPASDGWR